MIQFATFYNGSDNLKEGFNSNGSQEMPNAQDQNYTPAQYRSAAGEHEEEKPGSIEKNKLKAVMDELKTANQLNDSQIRNLIGKLADVFRSMK